jgi:hypothetical protein
VWNVCWGLSVGYIPQNGLEMRVDDSKATNFAKFAVGTLLLTCVPNFGRSLQYGDGLSPPVLGRTAEGL